MASAPYINRVFWRDVAAQTISSLITAAVLFVIGKAAGLFAHISWSVLGYAVLVIALIIGALYLYMKSVLVVGGDTFIDALGNVVYLGPRDDRPQAPDGSNPVGE